MRSNAKSNLIKGLYNGCASFGDYDGDGDLDLIVMGLDSANYPQTILYKNTGNTYIKIPDQIQGLSNGSVEWGDFDNDGDLDLLITGYDLLYESHTVVYENTGNDTFIPYHEFFGNSNGEAKWVDLNNDGYLDVVVTGGYFTDVYENFYGTFYYVADIRAAMIKLFFHKIWDAKKLRTTHSLIQSEFYSNLQSMVDDFNVLYPKFNDMSEEYKLSNEEKNKKINEYIQDNINFQNMYYYDKPRFNKAVKEFIKAVE